MGRKLKFPTPADCKPAEPAVLCPAERVLGLFNQAHQEEAKRIAKKVRAWFAAEAHEIGWAGMHFLPDVQSKHGAGCVLWLPPRMMATMANKAMQTAGRFAAAADRQAVRWPNVRSPRF